MSKKMGVVKLCFLGLALVPLSMFVLRITKLVMERPHDFYTEVFVVLLFLAPLAIFIFITRKVEMAELKKELEGENE